MRARTGCRALVEQHKGCEESWLVFLPIPGLKAALTFKTKRNLSGQNLLEWADGYVAVNPGGHVRIGGGPGFGLF
jgi:hypothetical protein